MIDEQKDDVELMLAFQTGDEQAFNHLYHRNKAQLFNFVCKFVLNRDVAEELTHEVFLRVYRAKSRYRPEAKFRTWLFHIATNVCLNELRKKEYDAYKISMNQENEDGGSIQLGDERSPDPLEMLETKELEKHVNAMLAQLPERQRIAFILSRFYGHSYEEIAKELDCSVKAVKSMLNRSKTAMMSLLKRS